MFRNSQTWYFDLNNAFLYELLNMWRIRSFKCEQVTIEYAFALDTVKMACFYFIRRIVKIGKYPESSAHF